MPIANQRRQRQALEYGKRLRVALDETGTSIYRLARVINPQSPESARSNIQRYLRGAVLPGSENRHELAHALKRPELLHAPDDEEDRDPVTDLMNALRVMVDEAVERRVVT